jgi:hypothetical protein
MLYVRVSDYPQLAAVDYETRYDQPLVPDEDNDLTGMTFRGKGCKIEDHPLKDRTNMHGCEECKSEDVLVIYGQWSVSTHSGDSYWDYEVVCQDCGKYTARSFNEND